MDELRIKHNMQTLGSCSWRVIVIGNTFDKLQTFGNHIQEIFRPSRLMFIIFAPSNLQTQNYPPIFCVHACYSTNFRAKTIVWLLLRCIFFTIFRPKSPFTNSISVSNFLQLMQNCSLSIRFLSSHIFSFIRQNNMQVKTTGERSGPPENITSISYEFSWNPKCGTQNFGTYPEASFHTGGERVNSE